MCVTALTSLNYFGELMIDLSTQTVPRRLTATSEYYHSTVAVNHSIPDQSIPNALPHSDNDLSGLFPNQNKLEAITPVNANSLFWLI